jgi:hypothetical protein
VVLRKLRGEKEFEKKFDVRELTQVCAGAQEKGNSVAMCGEQGKNVPVCKG